MQSYNFKSNLYGCDNKCVEFAEDVWGWVMDENCVACLTEGFVHYPGMACAPPNLTPQQVKDFQQGLRDAHGCTNSDFFFVDSEDPYIQVLEDHLGEDPTNGPRERPKKRPKTGPNMLYPGPLPFLPGNPFPDHKKKDRVKVETVTSDDEEEDNVDPDIPQEPLFGDISDIFPEPDSMDPEQSFEGMMGGIFNRFPKRPRPDPDMPTSGGGNHDMGTGPDDGPSHKDQGTNPDRWADCDCSGKKKKRDPCKQYTPEEKRDYYEKKCRAREAAREAGVLPRYNTRSSYRRRTSYPRRTSYSRKTYGRSSYGKGRAKYTSTARGHKHRYY